MPVSRNQHKQNPAATSSILNERSPGQVMTGRGNSCQVPASSNQGDCCFSKAAAGRSAQSQARTMSYRCKHNCVKVDSSPCAQGLEQAAPNRPLHIHEATEEIQRDKNPARARKLPVSRHLATAANCQGAQSPPLAGWTLIARCFVATRADLCSRRPMPEDSSQFD